MNSEASVPASQDSLTEMLSPWWRHAVILIMIMGFSILVWLSARTYKDAPPIPDRVLSSSGETIFGHDDIIGGQQVFLKYGLMENGTIWGHGAYLGPDFSAEYLHVLGNEVGQAIAQDQYGLKLADLNAEQQKEVGAQASQILKQNRYDGSTRSLLFTKPEELSYRSQLEKWARYFSDPTNNGGLAVACIKDPEELSQLTSFFAWTAWASVANRPGFSHSYTNNFPYDPDIGNTPTSDAILWSALSLITLMAGIAVVLFVFGRFDYLGWKGKGGHVHPQMLPGTTSESQKATIKFFVVVSLLFLAQVAVGGATAHYRADPGSFYGLNLFNYLPSNVVRTWHLQLAIFWVVTSYIAGGLLLASSLGGLETRGQARWINLLFGALVLVVAGSLLGELLGIKQLLGRLWFWLGDQGWEYLDLGRLWQVLLAAALVLWVFLIFRATAPARGNHERRTVSSLLIYPAIAIPVFYLPAMFFTGATHFTIVDTWRFWIVHLWVEDFLELFVTAIVAIIFYQLGIVSHVTATRVVYLDAILYLGSGIVGTGHHWYFTGQSHITMALASMFSAMEVVPLVLLTLDAWDFVKLTKSKCSVCGKPISIPHKWTFYFLMAVGFWNFVGAGVFGLLINLPIVSYYEVGTILTPNHAHASMMGVFGMLAVGLMVFAFRQVLADQDWDRVEKYVRISFWGLNAGLALMVVTSLFPGGVMQLLDVLKNGYWHARSREFLNQGTVNFLEWLRLPADLIFISLGVVPTCIAAAWTYLLMKKSSRHGALPVAPQDDSPA
jgi:nitric oxide reductase subunit B